MRAVTDDHVLCTQMVQNWGKDVESLPEVTQPPQDSALLMSMFTHFSPKFSS